MKKIVSLLFLLVAGGSVSAQTSTLPSSLGDFKLFRNAKAPFTMVTDPGFEKDTVIVELWNDDIKLSDSTEVTLSGDTIKFTLTKQQIAPLIRNAKMFIRFSSDSTISPELGANVTTSFGIGVPNIASRNIQLPGRGLFRVSVIGDASEAIQAAARAKTYRDSTIAIFNDTSPIIQARVKKGTFAQFKADAELFDSYELLYGNRSGFFVYDATDTTTPEDTALTIVKGSRRYHRQFTGPAISIWFGIVGDGVTEQTTRIQKMVDNPRVNTMWFPKTASPYRINYIIVPSNKTFLFEDGTQFLGLGKLGEGDGSTLRMFRIFEVENVVFRGRVTFKDIKANYAGPSEGEQRHIFLIQGSKNVTIEGVTAGDSGGDGFYVGATPTYPYSENIILRDCIADNNKRQGMSIISVKNMLVDNCIFKNTAGIAPGAGIDLEPNNITDRYQNLRFINCRLENNEGDNMLILLSNNTNSVYPVDIVIENMISVGGEAGIQFANCRGRIDGEIVVKNFYSQESRSNGIRVRNWSANGPRITVENSTISNPNSLNGYADTGYGAGVYIVRESSDVSDTLIGNAHFYNLKIEDNRDTVRIKAGFSMGSTTYPIVNCSLINPMSFKGVPAAQLARLYGGGILVKDDHNVLTELLTDALPGGSTLGLTKYRHLYHNEGQASERQVILGNMGKYWKAELVFEVRAAQYLRIDPNAANTIRPLTTVGGNYIRSNVVGSRIVLNWDTGSAGWVVKSIVGTWEVQP